MKQHTKHKRFHGGYTLVEVMIVMTIVGTLSALGLMYANKARIQSQMEACKSNLRLIQGYKTTWETFNSQARQDSAPSMDELTATRPGEEIMGFRKVECPAGGTYTTGQLSEKPSCSIEGHTL